LFIVDAGKLGKFLKHKRIVGEVEVRDLLIQLITSFIIGFGIGLCLGILFGVLICKK
jgi:hypothetical protein